MHCYKGKDFGLRDGPHSTFDSPMRDIAIASAQFVHQHDNVRRPGKSHRGAGQKKSGNPFVFQSGWWCSALCASRSPCGWWCPALAMSKLFASRLWQFICFPVWLVASGFLPVSIQLGWWCPGLRLSPIHLAGPKKEKPRSKKAQTHQSKQNQPNNKTRKESSDQATPMGWQMMPLNYEILNGNKHKAPDHRARSCEGVQQNNPHSSAETQDPPCQDPGDRAEKPSRHKTSSPRRQPCNKLEGSTSVGTLPCDAPPQAKV